MRVNWKWRTVSVAAGGLVCLALAVYKKDTFSKSNINETTQPQRIPAAAQVVQALKQEVQSPVVTPSIKKVETVNLPQPEVIQSFKIIQTKVFKNKDEQKILKQMLFDSRHLLQLSLYLKNVQNVQTEEFNSNQNAVIDILIEALKEGDAVSAEQAILDVIKDSQVEDEKIPLKSREVLAGIKADLLYQSSSIKPVLVEQIEKILPGPVSQKIWKNVQQQQTDNLALSEAEIQNRIAHKEK